MNFRRLQQQAASCVDELLSVSMDMDEYVIAAYGKAPRDVVDMQCRIQLEQLKRLRKKLAGIREELAPVTGLGDGSEETRSEKPEGREAERLSGEQRRSVAVTEQIIAQNLLIIAQKEELLNGFLAHSAMVGIQQKRAKESHDTAEIIRLRKILRGEQALCRTESEK